MPRKAFVADIQAASAQNTPGITAVTRGADDNDVIVCFTPASGLPIEITAMVNPGMSAHIHSYQTCAQICILSHKTKSIQEVPSSCRRFGVLCMD